MSTNLQPISLGLIAIQPYLDFVTVDGSFIEDEGNTVSILQNDAFENPPTVFIDGLLITYVVSADRRYATFNPSTKTLVINNDIVRNGEIVQVFL